MSETTLVLYVWCLTMSPSFFLSIPPSVCAADELLSRFPEGSLCFQGLQKKNKSWDNVGVEKDGAESWMVTLRGTIPPTLPVQLWLSAETQKQGVKNPLPSTPTQAMWEKGKLYPIFNLQVSVCCVTDWVICSWVVHGLSISKNKRLPLFSGAFSRLGKSCVSASFMLHSSLH